MSKSFSAAFKSACLALLLLAACNQKDGDNEGGDGARPAGGVITRPDTSVDEVASAEPGIDRHQWDAADNATRAVTGNLTASVEGRGGPLMLAFATGITVQAERDIKLDAAAPVAEGAQNFADVMGADPDATVFLFRVTGEDVKSVAKQGGLCGDVKPTFVAVTEYVGTDGEWVFKVAAFKGPALPGPGAVADPQLCGAYQFKSP